MVAVCVGLSPQLFAVAQDQEFARVAGLRVRAYNLLIAVLAAVTVTVAMRTVGLLLVSALMVVPVATAQQLARSFRDHAGRGHAARHRSRRSAACCSRRTRRSPPNVAPGPTIVLLAGRLRRRLAAGVWLRRGSGCAPVRGDRRPRPRLADHDDHGAGHVHAEDCGHLAVEHGDHVDYVHDGHRHAPHGEHYDEH